MIVIPADEDMGPAMRKLSDARKRFVLALIANGGRSHMEAAAAAGYGTTDNAQRVAGHRLFHHPDVQDALLEEARALGKVNLIRAVAVETELLERRDVPAVQLKASENIQARHGLGIAKEVNVRHTVQHTTTAELKEELRRLREDMANENPMLAAQLPPSVIDGEFEEVVGSSEGIEDLLA